MGTKQNCVPPPRCVRNARIRDRCRTVRPVCDAAATARASWRRRRRSRRRQMMPHRSWWLPGRLASTRGCARVRRSSCAAAPARVRAACAVRGRGVAPRAAPTEALPRARRRRLAPLRRRETAKHCRMHARAASHGQYILTPLRVLAPTLYFPVAPRADESPSFDEFLERWRSAGLAGTPCTSVWTVGAIAYRCRTCQARDDADTAAATAAFALTPPRRADERQQRHLRRVLQSGRPRGAWRRYNASLRWVQSRVRRRRADASRAASRAGA